MVLSDANTAGIASPFASLVSPPTSMTSVHFNGGTFGTSNSAVAVRLDPWPTAGGAPISEIGFVDGYAHIGGPAFIDDTGSPGSQGIIQGIRITGWRTETYSPAAIFAKFNNSVSQVTIDAAYTSASPTVPPIQFKGAWGRYSLAVADITLRPGDWTGAYPSTVVYCYRATTGVVIHDFVGPNGTPTHNNCPGAHEM